MDWLTLILYIPSCLAREIDWLITHFPLNSSLWKLIVLNVNTRHIVGTIIKDSITMRKRMLHNSFGRMYSKKCTKVFFYKQDNNTGRKYSFVKN